VELIEADGFRVAEMAYNLLDTSQPMGRVVSLGNQISLLAHTFMREKPDIVVAIGDREEAITTTLTAAYLNLPCAHIAGGDIAKDGNIDNAVRYAASKFAHLHFTLHPNHSLTLQWLGEEPWRIHTVGNPAIDRLMEAPLLNPTEVYQALGISADPEPYLLITYHPIITHLSTERDNVRNLFEALLQTGMRCFINSPNSDAGYQPILDTIQAYTQTHPKLHSFRNLDRITYINLMRHASCMVGNSSSGLVEVPSLGLPVVNVGPRQRGRLCSNNVIFTGYDIQEIVQAITKSVHDASYRDIIRATPNPYGDGTASVKIAETLATVPLTEQLLFKNITYEWPKS
jgi:GDP/UDP-N,N'-diacetylbacillosamine 2-epimerase (hydrolysing)